MNENIFFVAVDVDDNFFHGCGIHNRTGEIREFKCKPTVGHLARKLEELKKGDVAIQVCYEATYLGFSLYRDLVNRGYSCEVIAPSLIPEKAGKVAKTDKLDSRKLAEYYRNGQLTKVHVPDEAEEMVRDLLRARHFIVGQTKDIKLYILSLCRRMRLNYREECGDKKKHYWTYEHRIWLDSKSRALQGSVFYFNISQLLVKLQQHEDQIKLYDIEIERLSGENSYREKVLSLVCYRGIGLITAMTLITELGDIRRFSHPSKLCSYAGMELREYSSGGHANRYHISKLGNRHIRRSVIESCQLARQVPRISKSLKARRQEVQASYIEIADRCMKRLYKKASVMISRGKEHNKVKVACARELLCFVWESLHQVSV